MNRVFKSIEQGHKELVIAGFSPVGYAHSWCESCWLFETEEEATEAYEWFKGSVASVTEDDYWGREYFIAQRIDYIKDICDDDYDEYLLYSLYIPLKDEDAPTLKNKIDKILLDIKFWWYNVVFEIKYFFVGDKFIDEMVDEMVDEMRTNMYGDK
jgi:hypothetical protein